MTRTAHYILPDTGISETAMPSSIKPMMALYSTLPENQNSYSFEYKWDGLRIIYYWDGARVLLESRNLNDVTAGYPEIHALGPSFGHTSLVLDGEIIALDEHGRASFNLLQHRFGINDTVQAAERAKHIPTVYMIFDVLYVERYSLLNCPYAQRRICLESLELSGPAWQISPAHTGEGTAVLESAAHLQIEGVVAKRIESIYEPGRRSGAWIKTKLVHEQEFVIGGFTLYKDSSSMIGALLVGFYRDSQLTFAGSVGTGFSDADRRNLAALLKKLRVSASPFQGPVPRSEAIYVEPRFVAEIEYRGWTGGDILRQPSFKGLRSDKATRDVVREDIRT